MSVTSIFSASTWSNIKSGDSFEILRTSRFQNLPYFLNLDKIWGSYCKKTKLRNSVLHPLQVHKTKKFHSKFRLKEGNAGISWFLMYISSCSMASILFLDNIQWFQNQYQQYRIFNDVVFCWIRDYLKLMLALPKYGIVYGWWFCFK